MIVVYILLSLFLTGNAAPESDRISSIPNLVEPFRSNHYVGYLNISSTKQLFYWYVESENKPEKDPLVLWLNGGPGCASLEGLFIEMGPFRVRNAGKRVERNPWTWNRLANIIYLDAPAGVGFSYYDNKNKTFTDDQVATDNFDALLAWFKKFPEMKSNDLYIAGESYAGTYVPMLSSKLALSDEFPQFKGMLIGNGCVDDKINFNTNILYQYYHGLIDETIFQNTVRTCCKGSIDCDFYALSNTNTSCGDQINQLSDTVFYSGLDPYFLYFSCYLNPKLPYPHNEDHRIITTKRHMLKKQMNHKYENLITPILKLEEQQPTCATHNDDILYLNLPEVRQALRIPNYVQNYSMCSMEISMAYVSQYTTMTKFFNTVIGAKKKVTLFNGDVDTLCNVVENAQFLKSLNGTLVQPATSWKDPNQLPMSVGFWTKYDGVELVTIKGGGHFPAAEAQKPKETFQMFQNFIKNQNYSISVQDDIKYEGNVRLISR
ncbi:unnamed protein product [Caenorhabditis bovis]|uniref:Carboxypeptidase n=1 Tax=Caenorhabditis bovis TaxID=2654633 RepID=A0A8S1ED15_9PELO|nr:unnamed protein product [Caenorhabditis bovis]